MSQRDIRDYLIINKTREVADIDVNDCEYVYVI